MTGHRRTCLAGLALLSLLATTPARATTDPWWGRDKALHFGFSAAIAGGGYAIGAAAFDERWEALLLGFGLAVGAGAAKELADLAGLGDPSWRDVTWDLVGTVAGLGLAWGLDLAIRGTSPDGPGVFVGARPMTRQVGFAFRF